MKNVPIRPEVWEAFEEMRKKIRKPMTEYAKKLILKKLSTLKDDPNEILEQSIMNSWQGIFPLRKEVVTQQETPRSNGKCRWEGCARRGIIGLGDKKYCREHQQADPT